MLKCLFKWHSIWIADFRQLRIRARQARVSPLNILYRHQSRRPPHANRVGDSSGPVDFENHTLIHGVTKAGRIFSRTASHKGHDWNEIEQSEQTFMYGATSRGAEEIRFSHALLVIVRRLNRAFFLRACS